MKQNDYTQVNKPSLEVGVLGDAPSHPLAFTMAMEIIIQVSKWLVCWQRLSSAAVLLTLRAYIDDITMLTTISPCIRKL